MGPLGRVEYRQESANQKVSGICVQGYGPTGKAQDTFLDPYSLYSGILASVALALAPL